MTRLALTRSRGRGSFCRTDAVPWEAAGAWEHPGQSRGAGRARAACRGHRSRQPCALDMGLHQHFKLRARFLRCNWSLTLLIF